MRHSAPIMTHAVTDPPIVSLRRRLWLLQLVPPLRAGRWISAMAILALLLGWFRLVGLFDDTPQSATAAALFFAVILAYIVPVFHYITERTRQAFDDIEPYLSATAAELGRWRSRIEMRSRRWIASTLLIGTGAWVAHTWLLWSGPNSPGGLAPLDARIATIGAPWLVWVVMTTAIVALIDNARLFRDLGRRVRIDLLDVRPLTAFARVAVSSTLAIIGAQAAFPIMLLDPSMAPAASIPGLIVTTFAMAELFVLPIWPVHRAIALAKRHELARIDRLIADVVGGSPPTPDKLPALFPYLGYRREIAAVHEWPFNTGITTRLAFYLIIPPLTWVAAALIDVAVERLL
jgi:hypothetical protein